MSSRKRGRPKYSDILTPSEWRVVHSAQHGLTNSQIGERLGISIDGVKFHLANALAKLGLHRKSQLRTWFTVPKNSALEGLLMSTTMPENETLSHIGQISRTVSDVDKAIEFYKELLGIPFLYRFGNLAFFDLEGTRLLLNETKEPNQDESILYFTVRDINRACIQLEDRGIEVTHKPHKIHTHENGTEEWMAFFEDPDKRPLALMATIEIEPEN